MIFALQLNVYFVLGLRIDGRGSETIRNHRFKVGGNIEADGSSYIEQGLNKVLVLITGPAEPPKKTSDVNEEKGNLFCHILNAPFSGPDWRKRRIGDRKNSEMESNIVNAFESVIMLELYPKSQIDIAVHIIEADGSLLCTIINAVTLALMDAGISMTDMICACSCGTIKQNLCLDLNQTEQNMASFFLPLAIKARTAEIIFIQLDSRLSVQNLELALKTATAGCRQICNLMEGAAVSAMVAVPQEGKMSNSSARKGERKKKQDGLVGDQVEDVNMDIVVS